MDKPLPKPAMRLYEDLLLVVSTTSPSAMVRFEFAADLLRLSLMNIECNGDDVFPVGVPLSSATKAANSALAFLVRENAVDEDLQRTADVFTISGLDLLHLYFLALAESSQVTNAAMLETSLKEEIEKLATLAKKRATHSSSPSMKAAYTRIQTTLKDAVAKALSYDVSAVVARKEIEPGLRKLIKAINDNKTAQVISFAREVDKVTKDEFAKKKAVVVWTGKEDAVLIEFRGTSLPNPRSKDWQRVDIVLYALVTTTQAEKRLEKYELTLEHSKEGWFLGPHD